MKKKYYNKIAKEVIDLKILALKKLGKGVIYSKINPKLSMDLRKIIPSLI